MFPTITILMRNVFITDFIIFIKNYKIKILTRNVFNTDFIIFIIKKTYWSDVLACYSNDKILILRCVEIMITRCIGKWAGFFWLSFAPARTYEHICFLARRYEHIFCFLSHIYEHIFRFLSHILTHLLFPVTYMNSSVFLSHI